MSFNKFRNKTIKKIDAVRLNTSSYEELWEEVRGVRLRYGEVVN